MSDRDVDAEFADIIARWDDVESLPDTADAPAATDAGTPRTPPGTPAATRS